MKWVSALVGALAAMAIYVPSGLAEPSWPTASQSLQGNRNQPAEHQIGVANVGQLKPKWVFTDHGDVSATPTVADGVVYFPDWGGYLNAVNADNGRLIWQRQVSDYGGQVLSRNSPLVLGSELILGDNPTTAIVPAGPATPTQGAHVFAVDRKTGHPIWTTQVDSNPAAIITSNPVHFGTEIVVGIASNEEGDATDPTYACCTFRGAVVALDASSGKILWKTYTVPSTKGATGDSTPPCTAKNPASGCDYTGAAVWGTPTIDTQTQQVFVATGNNYTAPDAAKACKDDAIAHKTSDASCTAPTDYFESVLALNLANGHIEWGHKVEGWDAWNIACAFQAPGVTWCPAPNSEDYDFSGGSPNLFTVKVRAHRPTRTRGHRRRSRWKLRTLVGDGQKSGIYWAFDPKTGKVVWHRLVGPGSHLGGILWGSAYDGRRIYTQISNFEGKPYRLAGSGLTDTAGSWAALDPRTGRFDWQTGTPGNWMAMGPASVANGVVYGSSMNPSSTEGADMYALDASTGKILWSFNAGSSVYAGAAIVGGTVYWGSGYVHLGFPPYDGNDKFYAFSLNGR